MTLPGSTPPLGEDGRGLVDDAKVLLIKSPIPRNVLSRHELASYCELLSTDFIYPQISTDKNFKWIITDFLLIHRFPQIRILSGLSQILMRSKSIINNH